MFPAIRQDGKLNPMSPEFDPFAEQPRSESDVAFCARMDADTERERQRDHYVALAAEAISYGESLRSSRRSQ